MKLELGPHTKTKPENNTKEKHQEGDRRRVQISTDKKREKPNWDQKPKKKWPWQRP